jgi:hypothetical protein
MFGSGIPPPCHAAQTLHLKVAAMQINDWSKREIIVARIV